MTQITASITRVTPTYALATDGHGTSYLILERNLSSLSDYLFDDLQLGSRVRFEPVEGPNHLMRGVGVEVLSV